ncbi:glucosaminidase domain-containing protein, partial [Staphylococcus sp. ACRSN]|uniref:N-acetylmuramoyl-L-alanine amidase n=1 Tax=Staphylococcus sp. ACRSN TaxID=2918214 RepID=UPI001EF22070
SNTDVSNNENVNSDASSSNQDNTDSEDVKQDDSNSDVSSNQQVSSSDTVKPEDNTDSASNTDVSNKVNVNSDTSSSNQDNTDSEDVKQDDSNSDVSSNQQVSSSDSVKSEDNTDSASNTDISNNENVNSDASSSNQDNTDSEDVKQDDSNSEDKSASKANDANVSRFNQDDVNHNKLDNDDSSVQTKDADTENKSEQSNQIDDTSEKTTQNEQDLDDSQSVDNAELVAFSSKVSSSNKNDRLQSNVSVPVARKATTSSNNVSDTTKNQVKPMLKAANLQSTSSQATQTRALTNEVATKTVTKAATNTTLPKYTPKVNSSINNYIRKNNYTAPNYEQDIASYLPKYNYRYGKPEGIVMHDTANDNSTITGEVNYMKNNYNSAFVHAYVDGNRIIETADTDYLAWGAGAPANERFIHVELVHTHDYDSFARSINNYADYAATNLRYYGLKPDSAEYDGAGTVWTHQAVSKYLGGSDHSDPHGYLASHNYSYDELYDLIYEKYLIQTGQVADWGTTSSNNGGSTNTDDTPKTGQLTVKSNSGVGRINSKNNGVYTTVYDKNGKATNRTNQTLKVTKTATLGQEKYYLVSDYNKGNLIGWVKQNDVNYNAAKSVAKINKSYKIKPGEVLYNVPWGTSSQKVGTVSGKSNQTFKATKQQHIGKTNYIYGTVNKVSGWVSLSKLTSNSTTSPSTDTNKLVVTNLTNQQGSVNKTNSGVYTSVYDKQGVQKSYVNGKTFKLSKKAALGSKQFYLITDNKTNTNMGWMLTKDIQVKEAAKASNTINKTTNVSKIGQLSTQNSGLKTTVFDEQGKDASKFAGKTYTITKQRTQGNNTYVLIQNTNQKTPIGWINTKDINTRNLSKAEAKKGQYTIKPTNNGLYAIPWGTKAQQIDKLSDNVNNKFNASKSLFVDKDEYVYGNVNNKTGWIAAKDLNKVTTQSNPIPQKYDYIIYNENGQYYLDPTATKGAGSLRDFYEGIFNVFEKQTINGVTWYHGKLSNGKTVWIKESDLRKELVKYYSTGLTLDQAVALQKGLSTKPQIQRVPGKWEDATADEVKSAMDANKLVKDPTQKYQFLRLDKSQNINATDLNKLLVGKGILEGQGEAFSQAAKENNINEVYLISHALLETGNGSSTLANGGDVINNKVVTNQPTKYYNMFGIGAVDHDAVKQGFITAKNNGWDSVKKAIVGGAQFIASSYINQGQNTLYKMRWNPDNPGVHQYATDVAWAKHNATRIKSFYDSMDKLGKYFDVNTYK